MPAAPRAERPRTISAADLVAHLDAVAGDGKRRLIAIVGPPAVGKSTFTEALARELDARRAGVAAVLAMDGFHFDDRVLEARGERHRKGAPHTFDVGGLGAMLDRLRADREEAIAVPVFDRALEIARAAAAVIPSAARLVLVEGNWLLLREPPWLALASRFDLTVMLRATEETLRRRLVDRWQGYGLTHEDVTEKVDGNDLPNARLALKASAQPDFVVATDA